MPEEQSRDELVWDIEQDLAEKLGNGKQFKRWQKIESYRSARWEWLCAWKRFAERHGLGCLYDIQPEAQLAQAFMLASLRWSDHPREMLKKRAFVIALAAANGDTGFFEQIAQTLKNRNRTKRENIFLSFTLLRHWFAGGLWLLRNKPGAATLSAYTGTNIETDTYRMAPSSRFKAKKLPRTKSEHGRYRFVRLKK